MTTCIAIASHSHGREREHRSTPTPMTMPTTASMRRPSPGSRSISRDASGMPSRMPTICAGLGERGDEAALAVVEVEDLLVVERRERERGR